MPRDLHELSKLSDSLSYLYFEKAVIERDQNAIVVIRANERIAVPISSVTVLMLGPGTSVTHAAMRVICDSGCTVLWCGEGAMRFYGFGMGETRKSRQQLLQAALCVDKESHLEVAKRMYAIRFPKVDTTGMTLAQLRGMEGVRVREAYRLLSSQFKVTWRGRSYSRDQWDAADPLNIALSTANACLYGLCQAAIISLGYSTALGFIHTGKQLSFVYDIADLYKLETTVPAAFETVGSGRTEDLERAVRKTLRRYLREQGVLKRIATDIQTLFDMDWVEVDVNALDAGDLWDDKEAAVRGGVNHSGGEL